ncbi:MmcQ/YjbR family DNA-binding protein [Mammaliicoccus sp. Dog046]|uniref:MmcQ/YjbR family DNA-binding protein n=1 Tax=Mammaliicoccus sp. Dog046 TaxID=3034233 RepID=UPI002B25ECA3|nr:MmcQ/YjbR family DNA-binding protein [Mammaliicoccus sp. Dog046]WQK85258.1 MmcQ/YjbR family DNA-binding protein [Mammaliicoccus sp. Dog046]
MIERTEVENYIKREFNIDPDYPWKKHTNYAVFRHKHNQKWFGLLMNINESKLNIDGDKEVEVLNVKVIQEFIGSVRMKKGIYPAYHMNKNNWVSINLNECDSLEEIEYLIIDSYELTH